MIDFSITSKFKTGLLLIILLCPALIFAEDSNNVTFTAEQTSHFKSEMEGSFSGIGVNIELVPDGIAIKGIIPGGGAEKAGLKAGEIITAIDDQSSAGLTIQQVVARLIGPVDSKVVLEIQDPAGASRQVEITRSMIVITGVESRQLENHIWLLRISIVNKLTPNEVRKQLAQMKEQNAAGIILDLRSSGGGMIKSLVEIASMFLPKGQTMWLYKPKDGDIKPVVNNNEQLTDLPMVVLIDAKADSGELIAAALKRSHRAKILGQKTSGFIATRNIIEKPDGTSEAVVTGDFYMTDTERITEVGIEPDIALDPNSPEEQIIQKCVESLGV
ncbi:MAG: S41 family peptidase [Phycisphaerae bacterium]|jgi:carboxyl-terminal processing protease